MFRFNCFIAAKSFGCSAEIPIFVFFFRIAFHFMLHLQAILAEYVLFDLSPL